MRKEKGLTLFKLNAKQQQKHISWKGDDIPLKNKETLVQEFKLLAHIYIVNKLQNQNLNTVFSIIQCNG